MDPELGEVTDKEGEAVQAVDLRRQRARRVELESKRRLAAKILEKCNPE